MKPLYVSYFTPGYAEEAAGLRESLDKFGLQHHIEAVPSVGDWTRNVQRKASFIQDMLRLYSGVPVVWLDADARVRRYPLLFDVTQAAFAAHWRNGTELLSGTMYFVNDVRAWRLLDKWRLAMLERLTEWDQRVLQSVIESNPIYNRPENRLPASYTRIFDAPEMCDPRDTVIEHLQASRRLKATA